MCGTGVALKLLSLVARHPLQCLPADDMTTGQQLRLVVLGTGLLAHGTDEDVVTLEVLGQVDLDRQLLHVGLDQFSDGLKFGHR